jgi:lipoprotein NlpD
VVSYAGNSIAVYGGLVLIKHNDSYTTAYGHVGTLLVARGQAVRKGQLIGRTGDTDSAEEPRLHFEVRVGAKPVDPVSRLPRRG